ncbi:hypothetical protein [Novipirellula caenicola]|uniref:Secreted protein n=1 Tax=Novipirellula caenicola TaxID=1536901 RepID=A0ABP9VYC2_9BACT
MRNRTSSLALTCFALIACFSIGGCRDAQNEVIDQSTVNQQSMEAYEAEMNQPAGGI